MAAAVLGRIREHLERCASFERRLGRGQRSAARRSLAGAAVALAIAFVPGAVSAADNSGPAWALLKPEQQRVLAPLHDDWPNLESQRKRKWIAIANRYPHLSADEQARVQRRMKEWASLSAEQRSNAREFYRDLEKLSPEEKQTVREKWEAYQQLPEDRRRQLATSIQRSPEAPSTMPTATTAEPTATPK